MSQSSTRLTADGMVYVVTPVGAFVQPELPGLMDECIACGSRENLVVEDDMVSCRECIDQSVGAEYFDGKECVSIVLSRCLL